MILRPDGKKLRRRAGFVAGYEIEKEGQPAADIVSACGSELQAGEDDSLDAPEVQDRGAKRRFIFASRPRTSR